MTYLLAAKYADDEELVSSFTFLAAATADSAAESFRFSPPCSVGVADLELIFFF